MRVALVTGGSRNIGRAIARSLAVDGMTVGLMGRRGGPLDEVRSEIEQAGGRAVSLVGDVSDPDDVARVVDVLRTRFGGVDVLVNNAVVRSQRATLEMPLGEWRQVLDVGLTGAFLCAQAVLPDMVAAGWGRIVNLAGVSGQTGIAGRAGVATAKAGIIGLTRALAAEFATAGVTVNAISPGGIDTDRSEAALGDPEEVRAHYARRAASIPVGRRGHVDEVAAACRYLVGDAAGFVTGQTLGVNGGSVMP